MKNLTNYFKMIFAIALLAFGTTTIAQNPNKCVCSEKGKNISTGYDNPASGLLANGSVDGEWKIVISPSGPQNSIASNPAHVGYASANPNSEWIIPTKNNDVAGDYTYEYTFNVPSGFEGNIKFRRIGADNDVKVYLDNVSNPIIYDSNQGGYAFMEGRALLKSCLEVNKIASGTHKIICVVHNENSATGLLVEGCMDLVSTCPCDLLAQAPQINGPTCFCWSKGCDTKLTYSVPAYDSKQCFKYSWSVDGNPVSGQNGNQLTLNCKDLKPGSHKISVTITCGEKTVTSYLTLTICEKPNPAFTMMSDGSSLALASTVSATHYWFLVKDNDASCSYTSGDTFDFLGNNPTASQTGLVANQIYTVYHFVYKNCDNGCGCWSSQIMCFKWMPPVMAKKGNPTNLSQPIEAISKNLLEEVSQIPAAFRKELPKEIYSQKSESKID
jgi:hypothetical protein